MRERVCKNCGGRKYVSVGQNMLKCEYCGTLYVDEQTSREEEILLAKVNELLREQDFEKALIEIDKILQVYPNSYEAYFLKALAKAKIVIYQKSSGLKLPRFFDEVCEISEDEDFLTACNLAPIERRADFEKISRRVTKIFDGYQKETENYDCFLIVSGESDRTQEAIDRLQDEQISTFIFSQKQKEEEVFHALKMAKVMLILISDEKKLSSFLHVTDRWKFFMSQNMKPRTSLICALSDGMGLPPYCQNVVSLDSSTFFEDVVVKVKNECKNFSNQVAKIESIKIEHVIPEKKAQTGVVPIVATPVGRYVIENVSPDSEAKKKWVFLCLKNGDFDTAKSVCEAELEQQPNSSELLFASLLISKKIKTRDEFFSNIDNFDETEKIERMLKFASRDYAENFVDDWEKLVENLNDVNVYLQFLTYLASFETPEREHFISCAENLAVETADETLISAVETCFGAGDVDRFINFYFALAQRHDDQKWFDKVLSLDEGHFESNLTSLLSNFKTTEDKLSFKDKEKVETSLSHMDQHSRTSALQAVLNMILPVAFCDLKRAEEQIDFYLSYAEENELSGICEKISKFFLGQRFFTSAEKYASIAVSKDKENANLYWLLVKIKMHCISDNELITSGAKVMTLPEWQTLLSISNEERFFQIASKANLFEGEKIPPKSELSDKVTTLQKLSDFLLRNEKIITEAEEENVAGAGYFRSQLVPIKDSEQKISQAETFEQFQSAVDALSKRLELLDLTLDMSINISTLQNRASGLSRMQNSAETEKLKQKKQTKKQESAEKNKKFFVRFVNLFLGYFPLAFTFLLGMIACVSPKNVFMFFSQEFLLFCTIYAIFVVVWNFVIRFFKKGKFLQKLNRRLLISLGLCDAVLFFVAVVIAPVTIEISSASELQTLIKNAQYSDFLLISDIDFDGKTWNSGSISGTFDGDGHTVSNVVLETSFISKNDGKICNLTLQFSCENTNSSTFGVLVGQNNGTISSCSVAGSLSTTSSIAGGLVGENNGTISSCTADVDATVSGESNVYGGLVGQNAGEISKCISSGSIEVSSSSATIGGLVGNAEKSDETIAQCAFNGEISCTSDSMIIGGLVGTSKIGFDNCYAVVEISIASGDGYVGGLIGQLDNLNAICSKSFCQITINSTTTVDGSLVGNLLGRLENSYSISTTTKNLYGERTSYSGTSNCTNLESGYYSSSCNFSTSIWTISDESLPKFVWEK